MATQLICTVCYTVAEPKRIVPGLFLIEIFLWLVAIFVFAEVGMMAGILFALPALAYSVWRITSIHRVCPACRAPQVIPTDSPHGRQLLENSRLSAK